MRDKLEFYEHNCHVGRYGGLSKSAKKIAAARRNIAKARAARGTRPAKSKYESFR